MQRRNVFGWLWAAMVSACFCACLGMSPAAAMAADAANTPGDGANPPVLSTGDCIKCHMDAPRDVQAAGMAHRDSVTCMDCHAGHPPVTLEIIPECGQCHSGERHFDELEQCLSCHSNPHRPLELTMGEDVTGPCLTCHDLQGAQLKEFPSYHSSLACTNCHAAHGQVPECFNCHQGHSEQMTQADCGLCHQAHKPLEVAYGSDLPSTNCAACHVDTMDTLQASRAKHKEVLCATCHEETHGNIPQCANCHEPHAEDMTQIDCLACHKPHSPLPVAYGDELPSKKCAACHDDIYGELSGGNTKHQELLCATCHESEHGNIPTCFNCHEPHSENMVQADCTGCHQAHKPAPVTYDSEIASVKCAACHEDAFNLLQANGTKHHDLSCATCHMDQHPTVPQCTDCHDAPHSEAMLSKFPSCGSCHNIAHDLVR